MDGRWDIQKFYKIETNNLTTLLNDISLNDQLLVVQQSILPKLNNLLTFTELTTLTPVRKIVIINEKLQQDLDDILTTLPNLELIFLIDIRLQLKLSNDLIEFINKPIESSKINLTYNIIYCTERTQRTNILSQNNNTDLTIPHFIRSQLLNNQDDKPSSSDPIKLFNWNILPTSKLDKDILDCNILYDSSGENLYSPKVLSMQRTSRNILIDNLVNSITSLLTETGSVITNSISIGYESKNLIKVLKKRLSIDENSRSQFIKESIYTDKHCGIETDLIVFDRMIDPITPLLTQLTYSGLLDDIFEISSIDGKLNDNESTKIDYFKDDIWNETKFLNFAGLGPKLNKLAKELQVKYDSRHEAESVGQIKDFVDSLGSLQERQKLLNMHTNLSSNILEKVEKNEGTHFNSILNLEQDILMNTIDNSSAIEAILELLWDDETSANEVIRLICLLSIIKDGIRDKDFEILRKEVIDKFGIEYLFSIERLNELGLFLDKTMINEKRKKNSLDNNDLNKQVYFNKPYSSISNWLNTLPIAEDPNDNEKLMDINKMKNPSFAYCGVVPLTTRLLEMFYDRSTISKNYSAQQPFIISKEPTTIGIETIFEQIYGDSKIIESELWNIKLKGEKIKKRVVIGQTNKNEKEISLVVFIGGITLGEIATIKFLENKLNERGIKKRFVIICDGISNSKKFLGPEF
ncbi:hypothetical protein TBLA_0I03000 [Henningerozyma blattae CBS 6284]|uniref:Uncharacterized protein n=1 Tax=Henningerozyma blattae (strain ATCC 34711 / CBS 6284 / DSM 70876 / NBRC 10599 / NRRL Y-10934 / UCD 77-7) TaxID=1071380 RepID=I2H9A4_HENB6|nr:hypothetical protein TBLA_0I03000 [Tetrapisispora blattae CBS 6284]CCH62956.1 hypothetical protein TBLA_0I03000 [Tetrapisispora blattae CBS 6284]